MSSWGYRELIKPTWSNSEAEVSRGVFIETRFYCLCIVLGLDVNSFPIFLIIEIKLYCRRSPRKALACESRLW